jgi:hypothetical protein
MLKTLSVSHRAQPCLNACIVDPRYAAIVQTNVAENLGDRLLELNIREFAASRMLERKNLRAFRH